MTLYRGRCAERDDRSHVSHHGPSSTDRRWRGPASRATTALPLGGSKSFAHASDTDHAPRVGSPPPRHVLLYGPPAAGKQTVGRLLAASTGFWLLHNHLSIDVVRHLFEFGAPGFWATVQDVRLTMVARAAEYGVDIISTYVFSPKEERSYVDAIHGAIADAGGETYRVQLRPSLEALASRAREPSRLASSKLCDPARILAAVEEMDLYAPIEPMDLSIDNSDLSPDDVAERIRQHFELTA